MQIEYALAAVNAGATSLGIKATNGVVIATERKVRPLQVAGLLHAAVMVAECGICQAYAFCASTSSMRQMPRLERVHVPND